MRAVSQPVWITRAPADQSLKSVDHKIKLLNDLPDLLIYMTVVSLERKTRLELATYSLEGYRSTKWATSAYFEILDFKNVMWKNLWARMDSNHRTRKRTDLQSVAVGHLATCPPEPLVGIEPTTYWLQISCSTGWAKVALCCFNYQGINATKNYTIKSYPKISLPKIREAKVREFDNCKNFERGIFYLYSASCEYL